MNETTPIVVWFRQDLRLADNLALSTAANSGRPVIPVFVLDDAAAGEWSMGAASRWWLHQSLRKLSDSLAGNLSVFSGDSSEILVRLAREVGAGDVVWNRCYEPWQIELDQRVEAALSTVRICTQKFLGALLFEPDTVSKPDGTPYKVFTPYYRNGCLKHAPEPAKPLNAPTNLRLQKASSGCDLDDLQLLPAIRWDVSIAQNWSPGEEAAQSRLQEFLDGGLSDYKDGRNRPDQSNVSRLSPHLHFGEVSPRQVWHAAKRYGALAELEGEVDCFLSELGWREFSHYVLYHSPTLPRQSLQSKFDAFPWRDDNRSLRRWQRGETGYPIIDAGMRELWQTGYMHNRVRMIAGSFLIKNLLLHWHYGEDWFWDTLVDADLANNSASWQWVAGCGADAAPYFRIFNPVTQGQKFDPEGAYVRRFVPELSQLPVKFVHSPWMAPTEVLESANVELGRDYPEPIVDLKRSRQRALDAFAAIRT